MGAGVRGDGMVPGVVRLGVLAVLFQLLVVAGFYGYLAWRNPVPDAGERTRAGRLVAGGAALVAVGQLAGLGAVGSLRTSPLLSFDRATSVANGGLVVALIGYVAVGAGFVVYGRATD